MASSAQAVPSGLALAGHNYVGNDQIWYELLMDI